MTIDITTQLLFAPCLGRLKLASAGKRDMFISAVASCRVFKLFISFWELRVCVCGVAARSRCAGWRCVCIAECVGVPR